MTGDLAYVTYFDKLTFYYEEELTKEKNPDVDLSDMIYIPNIPLIVCRDNHNSEFTFLKRCLKLTKYFFPGNLISLD